MAISSVAPAGAIVDRDGRTWTIEELLALVDRAEKDDVPALSILEDSFSANQWWWECFGGDIARQAEEGLVMVGGGSSDFRRLAVRKMLVGTRVELAGPCPTPLVSLAARRVAMCKLEADLAYRTSVAFLASKEVPPDAIQGWLDRAEARYRKSLKTLADLQRLQLPVVQVNVGGQQVNIATDHLNLPSLAGAAVPTTPAKWPRPALESPSSSVGPPKRARTRGEPKLVLQAAVEPGDGESLPSDPSGPPSRPDAAATAESPTSRSSKATDPVGGSRPPLAAQTARRGRVERHAGERTRCQWSGLGHS